MKKSLTITYLLSMFMIPLGILYFNTDAYLVTATKSMIEYLQDFLIRLGQDNEATVEYKQLFFKVGILVVAYKVLSKMIFDRKLGLTLKQRKGDWLITLWSLGINLTAWFVVYASASMFNVNTDKWVESFNLIYLFVLIGTIAKIWNTYNYYVADLTK